MKKHLVFIILLVLVMAGIIKNGGRIIYVSIILVCICLLTVLKYCNKYIRNRLYHFLSVYPTRNNNYINLERNYDIACIGSTEAVYAVKDGDKSNLKILNWSSENQTLSYSFLILKNGFSLLKEAGHVVLFITPFSFWGKEADDKNRIRYDFFLDRFLLYFHDAKKFHLRDYVFLNVINRRRKDSVFLRAFAYYPVMYPIKAVKLLLELNERENILKNEKRIPGRRHYKPYTVQNDLSTIEKNCIENKKIVLELCRFLQERNLRLVVAVPPAPKDVLSYYQAIFLEKNITDIANSGINIPVLNYLDRQEFCNDDLYLDGRRLNSTGRDLFTECLLQDIENL